MTFLNNDIFHSLFVQFLEFLDLFFIHLSFSEKRISLNWDWIKGNLFLKWKHYFANKLNERDNKTKTSPLKLFFKLSSHFNRSNEKLLRILFKSPLILLFNVVVSHSIAMTSSIAFFTVHYLVALVCVVVDDSIYGYLCLFS